MNHHSYYDDPQSLTVSVCDCEGPNSRARFSARDNLALDVLWVSQRVVEM